MSITHGKGMRATELLMIKTDIDIRIHNLCLDLLGLVLKENYFLFQDTFYVQQQAFEEEFIFIHPLFLEHSRVWRRYIDDIFCVWSRPMEPLLRFDSYINNISPEFTITEQYSGDKMSFLDTLVNKNNFQRVDRIVTNSVERYRPILESIGIGWYRPIPEKYRISPIPIPDTNTSQWDTKYRKPDRIILQEPEILTNVYRLSILITLSLKKYRPPLINIGESYPKVIWKSRNFKNNFSLVIADPGT
ncbi:unnamed protein product [Ranitomeya imitator]|uniref:Maturase K n=1 Tax=Ranitomeya imitator TaxID=111125 RepID=A0ABN9LYP2_9NEOB|nr:unnamed protein product [Ranitomeya imitator]